jgi:murein DD-endopeptidase MepM/ murein hydrolase activator NlpD
MSRLAHRPTSLVAALLVVLLGGAAAAFGIAPLAPDAAKLPQRIVTQSVAPSPVAAQLEALANHELQLYRSEHTRVGDTADTLLQRLGVVDPDAAEFLRRDPTACRLLEGRAGKMTRAAVDAQGRLVELVARYPGERDEAASRFSRLTVARTDGGYEARVESAALEPQLRLGSGTIRTSLFAATDEARLPEAVAVQVAEMFATDIDFGRDLRRGDTFSVVYEALTADGEPITWPSGADAVGRVVAAEFVNAGRAHTAVWYQASSGKGGYYGLDGQSKRRSFLASPMEFSRVSSGFKMRLHPILKTWRRHLGVDYAAPTGTPVRSVGDGVIDFAGRQGGYGNVVHIRHGNERLTTYAHLSRIDVRPGQRVEQGQRIGAVGATGWATGPHLHFEFRVRGEHRDPQHIAKTSEAVVLGAADRARFTQVAAGARAQLDAADRQLDGSRIE